MLQCACTNSGIQPGGSRIAAVCQACPIMSGGAVTYHQPVMITQYGSMAFASPQVAFTAQRAGASVDAFQRLFIHQRGLMLATADKWSTELLRH